MTSSATTTGARTGSPGPATALTGLGSAVAFIGIIVVSGLLFSTGIPRPDAPAAETQQFFTDNAGVVRAGAVVRVAASVLLVAFCATMAGVLRRADRRLEGAAGAVVAGGALSAIAATLSVLFAVALTTLDGNAAPVTDAMRQLNFLTGGAGYTVWLALVVGPLCLALRQLRALPGWLSTAGLVAAVLALLSALSLAVDAAMLFIPLGRFSALLVIAVVSALLATGRLRPGAYRSSARGAVLGGLGTVVVAMLVTVFI